MYVREDRSFQFRFDLAEIRRPSFNPGPRNALQEDRFSLCVGALKMYGTPASAAIFATFFAISSACASLSDHARPRNQEQRIPAPRRSEREDFTASVSSEMSNIQQGLLRLAGAPCLQVRRIQAGG